MSAAMDQFPDSPEAHLYDPRVLETAFAFLDLRFEPERLGEVARDDFHEHEPAVWLDGHREWVRRLADLQRYREQFGAGRRIGGSYLLIPQDKLWTVPGTDKKFTVGVILEDINELPDGTQFAVRMNEQLEIVEDPSKQGGFAVVSRKYRAIGSDGPLPDHGSQHAFAGQQIEYAHQYGHRMPLGRTIQEIYEDPATYRDR